MALAKSMMLLALLAGCPDRTISALPPVQDKIEVKDIPAVPNRKVDILFVVDDSPSMEDEQASLRANFQRFIAVLESLDGGLPDVHIGVITPNLGTSALDGTMGPNVGTCAGRGEAGGLHGLPDGSAFIVDVDDGAGGRQRNYSGTLADAFSQIANVGANGCGIEQHLEATKRALDGSNAKNAGFLRQDAYLAVVIVADEDDCSLQKSTIFDAPANGSYGDVVNFRCTSQGVECDDGDPDLNVPGPREECHPKQDSTLIANVDRYVGFLQSLKSDPRDIVFAGILGNPTSFATTDVKGPTTLADACSNAQVAFPAIRTFDVMSQFEHHSFTSICDADLSRGLVEIGAAIKDVVNDPCFDSTLLDADPETAGPQYDCSIVEFRRRADGTDEDLRVIPPCTNGGGALPCWHVEEDAEHCAYTETDPHLKLVIDRDALPPPDVRVRASCVTTSASSGPVL